MPDEPVREFDDLFADYLDRLNAGESLDPLEVLYEQPQHGPALLEKLESFIELTCDSLVSSEPLGTLGDYTLRRQIGRGGMGVVYEAWQNSVNRQVALKVLPAGIAADRRACARFLREAQTAGQLNHEHVVRVYSTGVEEGTPWYSMEYVEGETLAQVVAKLKDAEPDVETPFGKQDGQDYHIRIARAFADVADGLQHAHSKGVIHRDIKPSNLILDQEGRLRILDFGLARLEGQDSLTVSGDFVGTPLYMSPEQARRRKIPVDHRTDVYSLGATMYEAICGQPPFKGKDHQDTLSQIIERDPVDPRALNPPIPRDLETIVLKCIEKSSSDRFRTAEALAQDLRRLVRGDPIESSPPRRLKRLGRHLWRTRHTTGVVVVSFVLVVSTAFFALKSHLTEQRTHRSEYDALVRAAISEMPWSLLSFRRHVLEETSTGGNHFEGDWGILSGQNAVGRVTEAERTLAAWSVIVPERPDAPYYRAHALELLGKREDALELLADLDRRLGFVPARIFADRIRGIHVPMRKGLGASWDNWAEGKQQLEQSNWAEAIDAYSRLLDASISDSELYIGGELDAFLGRGYARLQLAEFWLAIEDFVAARNLWPSFLESSLLLGKAYHLAGNESAARRTFDHLHDSSGRKDEVAFWVSVIYRSVHDREQAFEWAEKVSEESVRERLKAVAHHKFLDFRQAIEAAARAIELDEHDACAHMTLAHALHFESYFRSGPDAPAIRDKILAHARRAVELRPLSPQTNSLYGVLARDESFVFRARDIDPTNPAWRARLAWFRSKESNYDEAEEHCRIALKSQPNDEWLHLLLGLILRDQGRYEEARLASAEAARINPHFWVAVWLAGQTFVLEGRHEEAAAHFEKALELEPEMNLPQSSLAYALLKLGRLEDSIRQARAAIAREPDTAAVHRLLQSAVEKRLAAIATRGSEPRTLDELEAPVAALETMLDAPNVKPIFLITGALLRLYAPEGRDPHKALGYASTAARRASDEAMRARAVRLCALANAALSANPARRLDDG